MVISNSKQRTATTTRKNSLVIADLVIDLVKLSTGIFSTFDLIDCTRCKLKPCKQFPINMKNDSIGCVSVHHGGHHVKVCVGINFCIFTLLKN